MADLISLQITNQPNKTHYKVGDKFEPYGMVVKGVYSDGTMSVVDGYSYSPTSALTTSTSAISISYNGKSTNLAISVYEPSLSGYFINRCFKGASIGDNPFINMCDGSVRYQFLPISIGRDSFKIDLSLLYFSKMTDRESSLIKGFSKGYRTNFHQFLIKDGKDENNVDLYKYIDGDGYIHTFIQTPGFNKYYDKEGYGFFLDLSSKIISDQNGVSLHFDSEGRLDYFSDSKIENHIVYIEYNNDGIRKIYDGRSPNKYIKFSYEFGYLKYIRTYNGENRIKKYTFNGFFGQINSIDETVSEHTRTVYKFSVNDRNRVNRFIDCINNDAYRITYNFDQYDFNDYIFESIRKGNIINNGFVEKSRVLRSTFYCYYNDEKFANEMRIIKNNGQEISYQIDTTGRIVSSFEVKNSGRDFLSLEKYEGKRLNYDGQSRLSINGKICESFIGSVDVNDGLSSYDLNSNKYVKFCGYIRLLSEENRVKIRLNINNRDTKFVDINPYAYDVWQYFEIPFEREMVNDSPVPFSSFTVTVVNEDQDEDVNVLIGDLHFVSSKEEPQLIFENLGNPVSFDELSGIKIKNINNQYVYYNTKFSLNYFLRSDLLLTFKRKFSFEDQNLIVYLNGGRKFLTSYGSLKLCFNNGVEFDVFDLSHVDNSSIFSNKSWYFRSANSYDDRTYYFFSNNGFKITNRYAIKTNSVDPSVPSIVRKISSNFYNYQNQIVEETTSEGGIINYEYFNDNTLRKKSARLTASSAPIIIYEETRNENSKSFYEDGVTSTVSYDENDLVEIENLPSINNLEDTGKIEYQYNYYLDEITNVSFKINNLSVCEQRYSRDQSNLIFTYDDCVSKYKIQKSLNNNDIEISVYDNGYFAKTEETNLDNYFEDSKYFNQSVNSVSIRNHINDYKKLYSISQDGVEKVSFWFEVNEFSEYAYPLCEINDSFANQTINIAYNEDNKISEYVCNNLTISYNDDPKILEKNISISGSENYNVKGNDYFTIFMRESTPLLISSFSFDSLNRLIKKTVYSNNVSIEQNITYFQNHYSRISNYDFGTLYNETYLYFDATGKLKNRDITHGTHTYLIRYEYDVLGRIKKEINSVHNLVREYQYCDDTLSPYYGRMIRFGDNNISYDPRGRVSSFGDIVFGYDNFGNRTSKTKNGAVESYSYERGKYLSNYNNEVSFMYDYEGKRTKKLSLTSGTYHKYYYEGSVLIGEDIKNDRYPYYSKLRYIYDSTGIVGFIHYDQSDNRKDYTYIKNPFNEIVGIADGSTLVAVYVYDAWGNHKVLDSNGNINTSSSFIGNINPIRYKEYYYDVETGLFAMGHRYYDPEIGRFISPDDVEYLDPTKINGLNLYAYCNNDPVNYVDPNGHFAITLSTVLFAAFIGFVAGAIVGGTAGGITAAATGDDVGLGILFGVLGGGLMGAGAGVGSIFIAPLIAGGSVAIAGQTLTTGAAWGAGLGIGFASGAIGGATQDFLNQFGNNDWDTSEVDFAQVGWSSLENGLFNTLSTVLGGFGGTDLSNSISFLLGMQLNVIPTGYTSISDIIRWYKRRMGKC